MELREYQVDALAQIREHIRQGKKNILLCAPTGSGKTLMSSYMVKESHVRGKRSAFVVDRVNLIGQTSAAFASVGIDHGVVQAKHFMFRPSRLAQICSAQTLTRRRWPDADLIIVDECHTVNAVVAHRIAPRDTVAIGLTATPFTKGLGKHYDALVNVTTTNRLIEAGFLAKYRIFAASQPNMEGVRVVAGEWEEKEASKRAMEVVGDCVAEYLKHGEGKKFICSAVDVAHVEELQRQFMAAGVICSNYTYRVKDEERADIVREFRKPDSYIRGLITVTAASKGFDVPDIGVVIMARPLRKSLTEHIQFFGRGLRTHPNKTECIVLDHSGNCERFWNEWNDFFEFGVTELDDGKKRPKSKKKPESAEDKMVKCGECKHLHKPMPFCPSCGHQYPARESVKHVAGTLTQMIAGGDRRTMSKAIWPQICTYARDHRTGEAARKLALALFKKMTGQWPTDDFDRTEGVELTNEVAKKIRSMNIAYARAKSKASVQQGTPE
ncbi:DEAD/DEAH box helicase [Robbsia andropogonis]|uniref:DEAD/DEAH box helicase n=1 Tax=Robbsia andropogonis TaxID=28092 RepID=UPI003D1A6F63